ncbi:MAG: thiamine pyrophosphate-dependent enzyme [Planctomycetota bacterium]|nr:thiamine pyrophosphate-dependent enzyme [Planctomycetota bacterium]
MNHADIERRMPVESVLRHLAQVRGEDQIVISNQSSARLWPRLSSHRLDFNYNPSTMSGAVPFAVGLAIARTDREVMVLSGDGSLLMSLGCLVTAVASGAANLSVVLLDNGVYEVTGGQKTPASESAVDYAGFAAAAGFPNVSHFWELGDFKCRTREVLAARGPRFLWLEVGTTPRDVFQDKHAPITERLSNFQAALRRDERA